MVCFFVFFVLTAPLPVNAGAEKPYLKSLKKAALNCQVGAFEEFMPQDSYTKINAFEEHMHLLDALTESIFARCLKIFGQDTVRTPAGIQIPISGKDPKWEKLFGPQWSTIVAANPDGPFYFKMNFFMEWDQECKVLQRFQACLEDKEFCSDFQAEGSVIRMTQKADGWQLIFDLPPEQEAQAEQIKSAIIQSAAWANNYLAEHEKAPVNPDFKYRFATAYFSKINQFLGALKPQ
ncbi:MAG TPA: hypothetical protein DHV36_03475 [Desulfobacteraceae bacterium]|nr:hypothetical protein [Desulfobacteraceae bacterium]